MVSIISLTLAGGRLTPSQFPSSVISSPSRLISTARRKGAIGVWIMEWSFEWNGYCFCEIYSIRLNYIRNVKLYRVESSAFDRDVV